ncbi:MAG TPA: hypothetical protein VL330_26410 [Actinomycetes bacterium]|nr:hypothetical protein [Actinomycetes bacterium]
MDGLLRRRLVLPLLVLALFLAGLLMLTVQDGPLATVGHGSSSGTDVRYLAYAGPGDYGESGQGGDAGDMSEPEGGAGGPIGDGPTDSGPSDSDPSEGDSSDSGDGDGGGGDGGDC